MKKILIFCILAIWTSGYSAVGQIGAATTQLDPYGGSSFLYAHHSYTLSELSSILSKIQGYGWGFNFETTPTISITYEGELYYSYRFTYPPNNTKTIKIFDFQLSGPMWEGKMYQHSTHVSNAHGIVETSEWYSAGSTSYLYFDVEKNTPEMINKYKSIFEETCWGLVFDDKPVTVSIEGQSFYRYKFEYYPNINENSRAYTFEALPGIWFIQTPNGYKIWDRVITQERRGIPNFKGFVDNDQLDKDGGRKTIFFHESYSQVYLQHYLKELEETFHRSKSGWRFSTHIDETRVKNGEKYHGYSFDYPPNIKSETVRLSFLIYGNAEWDGVFKHQGQARDEPCISDAIPSTKTNWILEETFYAAGGEVATSDLTYFDNFGRPIQHYAVNGSAHRNKDIVSVFEYDHMGRSDAVTYLPYVSSAGNLGRLTSNPVSAQQSYYRNIFSSDPDKDYAYGSNVYDQTGLVTGSHGPGQSSHDYPMVYEYGKNKYSDGIKRYEIYSQDGESLYWWGTYQDDMLTVYKIKQSNLPGDQQRETHTYTNFLGQTVAKEVRVENERRITYYVYDDMERLRYIIPPIQENLLTQPGVKKLSELHPYCYYMEYDEYGRICKQYVPGRDPVYSLYDKRGRLVMTQDGNQRSTDQWSFTKYDELNRPIMTGTYTGGTFEGHRAALQSQTVFGETRGNAIHYYSNNTYPIIASASDVLLVNYYDDYDWLDPLVGIIDSDTTFLEGAGGTIAPSKPTHNNDFIGDIGSLRKSKNFSAADALGNEKSDDIIGLKTGNKVKVLGIETNKWLETVVYYDDKYQSIQSISDLYPSGTETVSNNHNFIGQVTQTKVKQTVGVDTYEYNKWFNYDAYGRLQNIQQQITGDELITIASYVYDDFGNIKEKKIHNGAETTQYTYNISGNNTGVSSPSFSYNLWFDKVPDGSNKSGRHDGNLSRVTWDHGLGSNREGYELDYDPWGQMTQALHMEWSDNPLPKHLNILDAGYDGNWLISRKYAEMGITYDKNGNMLTLQRGNSARALQSHDFHYSTSKGNQLSWMQQGNLMSLDFVYDKNGNMTLDAYKNLNIEYNILDLPSRMYERLASKGEVKYIYSAAGEKLAQEVDGSSTYYRGVMVYGKQGTANEQLMYMIHPEGSAIKLANNTYQYQYFKTDHLGSTRVVLSGGKNTLTHVQSTDYYPFGLPHTYDNTHVNKYLFVGKELQDGFLDSKNFPLYDFHARFYNPTYGRWFNVDPALQSTNPYIYCANSPMMYTDPDGKFWWVIPLAGALKGGFSYGMRALKQGGYSNTELFINMGIGGATAGMGAAMSPNGKVNQQVGYGYTTTTFNVGLGAQTGPVSQYRMMPSTYSQYMDATYGSGNHAASASSIAGYQNNSYGLPYNSSSAFYMVGAGPYHPLTLDFDVDMIQMKEKIYSINSVVGVVNDYLFMLPPYIRKGTTFFGAMEGIDTGMDLWTNWNNYNHSERIMKFMSLGGSFLSTVPYLSTLSFYSDTVPRKGTESIQRLESDLNREAKMIIYNKILQY